MGGDVRTGPFSVTLLFLSSVGFGTLCSCFKWDFQPDPILFACKGIESQVSFPWLFSTGEDEAVEQINWVFDSENSSTMLASFSNNLFLANPDYVKRVHHVPPGGLVLNEVKVSDTGNYSVEVTVKDTLTSCLLTHRRSFTLQVGERVMLDGGQLKARQDPVAHWEEKTHQWFIHLTCGHFTFWGTPPVHVVWTTPSGDKYVSKDYRDGHFYFKVLPAFLEDGAYSCEVPDDLLPEICFSNDPLGPGSVQANVEVDELKARLSVVESGQRLLLKGNKEMDQRMTSLERKNDEELGKVTQFVTGTFQQQLDDLEREQNLLKEQIENLRNVSHTFDVTKTFPCSPGSYTTDDKPERNVSKGDGSLCDKDLPNGWYRFMLNGKDAEIPTACVPKNHCSTDAPMWVDLQGKSFPKVGETVEARACANWDNNCCNWKKDIKVRNCGHFYVYENSPLSTCSLSFCVQLKGTA